MYFNLIKNKNNLRTHLKTAFFNFLINIPKTLQKKSGTNHKKKKTTLQNLPKMLIKFQVNKKCSSIKNTTISLTLFNICRHNDCHNIKRNISNTNISLSVDEKKNPIKYYLRWLCYVMYVGGQRSVYFCVFTDFSSSKTFFFTGNSDK